MRKEAFQEIAKHFAESIKVKLVFEDGATPATNGETIILPTEMSADYLDETLGALLHETNHIRYTDMGYFKGLDQLHQLVGNVVEDIRVDYKSLHAYPNSKCFYTALIDDVLSRAKEVLDKEDTHIKKLKSLILDAFGIDIEKVYGKDKEWDSIKECTYFLRPTIFKVYGCEKTKDITEHIIEIIRKVFEDHRGGDDSDGEDDNIDDKPEQIREAVKQYCDALGKKSEANKEAQQLDTEVVKAAEQYKKMERSRKTYNTKARNTKREAYYNPSTDLAKKAAEYEQKALARQADVQKAYDEYTKKTQLRSGIRNELSEANDEFREALSKLNGAGFSSSQDCNLLGFNALDGDKLKDKNYVETAYTPQLDELIKEVLILKQEEYQTEETGKINPRYLHEIYTDVENIFQEKEEKNIKTRVSLVVDKSGSMDSFRTKICLNAVNILANAFKKAINQGAPGEMRIYAFADDVKMIVENVENYITMTEEDYFKKAHNVGDGGTNLARSVNLVVNDVEGDPEFRNIIIIITDAEVDGHELNDMANNISTSDARVMYIAVQSNFGYCPEAKELFQDNNIQTLEDAPIILERVVFNGLQMIN